MFNKVILLGNLTRDIELRYASSGMAIGPCGIAVNRKYKVGGESKEEVCFVDITFFGRTAEVANQYLKKGSKVLVEGRLKLEQWQDQSGNKRSKHSISVESMQMLSGQPGSGTSMPAQGGGYAQGGYSQPRPQAYAKDSKPQASPPMKEREIDVDNFEVDDTELPF